MELHRVHSVKQTSMAATGLPLELQQQIFSCLDPRSFNAARAVCRYWHYASQDSVTLEKQLRKLPILPQPNARESSAGEMLKLFDDAAHTLMLGMHVKRERDAEGAMDAPSKQWFHAGPHVCATTNGTRTVTINNRQIALYDTTVTPFRLISKRPINDLKETVGSGPWLKISPLTNSDLALSSDGTLLAIAQDRTIQIYDLLADSDSFTVNQYISSASGHYICGLNFEQDDHVLRVQLSGRGVVLYCGAPPSEEKSSGKADIEHWKSKSGLRHTMLDSHILTVPEDTTKTTSTDQSARLSGLQLLKPFQSGYLFAAQRHGGGQSSHYVLGHIRATAPHNTTAPIAEPNSISILAKLESFLSGWDYTLHCLKNAETGFGLWETTPSAHEHHPSFALAPQANLLVLAERDKKCVRPSPLAQLYTYRIPSESQMIKAIAAQQQQREGKWASLASFLDKIEASQGQRKRRISMKHDDFEAARVSKTDFTIGRVPICLGTIEGDLTKMRFEEEAVWEDEGRKHVLSVETADASKRWGLLEL